jgi:SpoVK/Ycf46/Vps4 family AAA+-type ATPase
MASAELIQELIRAHVGRDDARFRRVALQLAAREARSGHRMVAGRIRDLLEQEDVPADPLFAEPALPTPIARPSRDFRTVLDLSQPEERLDDIVLEDVAAASLDRLLVEQHAGGKLAQWSLTPRRKLLLHGPPGCGKTLTARVIAGELGLPLIRVRVESLFSRYLGETASILVGVFDEIASRRAVFLFDEFDAIGKQRADDMDIGEARRIVSTFLQLLDADRSSSIVIAATNQRAVLDEALFRRFDDVVPFALPSREALLRLLHSRTAGHGFDPDGLAVLARVAEGLSYADAARAVDEAAKSMVLGDRTSLTLPDLEQALSDVRAQRHAG